MNKTKNFVRKQLLLTIMMLLYVVSYGATDYLPRFLYDDYTINPTNNAETWLANTVQMAIEESLASSNHRFIAMRSSSSSLGGALKFDDRVVRFYDGESIYTNGIPGSSELFKCFDSNIPDVYLCNYQNGTVGNSYKQYENLSVGYNYFSNGVTILVLPMLTSVSNSFYKSYYRYSNETISIVTEGDEVWFACTAEGTGVEAFACTKGGFEMIQLNATKFAGGGSSCSFRARLLSSLSHQEEQDIYIFSYIESNGKKYYSSNYKKMQLTVNPAIQFVNAFEVGNILYVTPDYNSNLFVNNQTNKTIKISLPDPNNPDDWVDNSVASKATTKFAWEKEKTNKINVQINGIDHNKTYTIKCLPSCGIAISTCSFSLTAPNLNGYGGITAYPIVNYEVDDLGQGHGGNVNSAKFGDTFNTRYKYTYYVRYSYKGKYIDGASRTRDFLPLKLTTTVENIKGCQNGSDESAGKVIVTASGGSGKNYTYSSDGTNYSDSKDLLFKTIGKKTVYVKDGYGCVTSAQTSKEIEVVNKVSATFNASPATCYGGNGKIEVTDIQNFTGTIKYEYKVSGTSEYKVNSGAVFNLPGSKSYDIKVSDNSCAYESKTPVEITQPSEVAATIQYDQIQCNGYSTTVTATNLSGGSGGGYEIFSNNNYSHPQNGNKLQLTGVKAGKQIVFYVKDAKKCKSADYKLDIEQPNPLSATIKPTDATCYGGNGKIEVTDIQNFTGTIKYEYKVSGTSEYKVNSDAVFNLPGGKSYDIKVSDNSCAYESDSKTPIEIKQPSKVTVEKYQYDPIQCYGYSTTVTVKNPSGGNGEPYEVFSNNSYSHPQNGSKLQLTGVGAGEQIVFYVKDAKDCKSDDVKLDIKQPNPISATITPTDATCYGGNGTINVTSPVNFTPTKYEYKESGTSEYKVNSGAVFNLPGGKSYDIKVSDNSCAYESDSKAPIEINQPSKVTVEKYQYDPIQCNGNNYFTTVTANNPSGGNGEQYEIFSTENFSHPKNEILKLQGVNSGKHIFYVKDVKLCESDPFELDITQPDAISIDKLENTIKADCEQATNGKVEVTASGGTGTLTYHLYNISDGTINSNNGIFTGLGAKTYTLSVTDANDCPSKEQQVTVGSNNLLTLPTPTITPVLCHGAETGSISLDPSFEKTGFNGKFKYWLNGEEKNSNLFEGLAASKNYEVKVQPDGSDCYVVLKNVEVGAPTTEQLTYTVKPVNFTTTTSSDARIDVTPSGGWGGHTVIVKDNNGAVVSDNTDLRPGKYTVTVTDVKGCVASDNKEYTIARPNTDLGLNVVEHINVKCHGESTGKIKVIASGGWGNYSYTLSPNNGSIRDSANYKIFENLPKDTYKVTVADKMDVVKTATIIIEQPDAALSASSKIDSVKCNGGNDGKITVTVTGGTHGTRGYTLSLDGNTYYDESGKIEITGKKEGVYKYTVVDANECVSPEYTVKIDEPTAIVLSADAAGELKNGFNIPCADETGGIVVSAKGGTAGYQFSIDGGPFTAPYGKDAKHTFSGLEAGEHKIMVKDGHECLVPVPVEVKLTKPEPIIIIDTATTQPKCYGYDGKITVKVAGGIVTQNYNYKLNTAEVVSDGSQHTFENIKASDDHKLVVTDANGCEVEMNDVKLGQPNKLDVSVSNVKNNLCNGDELGIITFEIHGGTAPYDYSLNGKDKVAFGNDTKITGLPAKDKHSIVVSDANGCKFETIEQEITEEDKITAQTVLNDYNGYNISCFGDADTARIKISGGVGNYRTTLDDRTLAGNDVKFDGLTEGSYSYKVIDGNNCSETFDFVMTEPANLSFVFVDSTDVKCYNKNNGKLLAVIKGGVANYVYDVTSAGGASINKETTNSTEYSYNSIAAGKYMLNVTDANNCVISQSYTIGQPDPLTVSVNKLKDVDCKGAETGAVSATAKGGIGAYSYSWNKGMTGHIAQNLPAGEYSVLVTDANNCQSEVDENGVKAQTTIDEPAAALTMLDPLYTNPTCSYNEDGIITINVSGGWGGYKYALNGVSYGSNSIEGLNEGTYTAKVTDAKGCEVSTNTITLKKPKALSFESSVGTIICNGGTTEVTITSASGGTEGNYSYSIDGEKTWQSGTTFTGVTKGNYTLKMKDGNECTTEHAVNVTEPDKLVLKEDVWHNYNGTTRKANGKITVTPQGGVMPYSYQWKDTTVTSQVLDNIGFGLYTIIVTDKLGCVETNTYYINDNNPTPEVVDAICPEGADGSIRFGETVECTRVEWYNARTEEQLMQSDTKTITGLPKGIYKAKLFNNSQVTYIYAEVKAPDSLEYVQNQTDIDCHGDDSGKASVSITGGVAPVSVIWKNQKGEEISRNQTIENLITGKYTAYISDAQNCQSSSKTLVFDITEPADAFVLAESAHNNVKCHGNNDAVVVLSVSGNQGAVTYFQNGAAIPSNEAKSLYAGDYAFYAVDAKNCKTQTMNVVVSQPEPLSSSVKTIMPIKCAAETGSVKVEAEGGITPYSYKVLEQNDFRLSPIFDGLTTADYKFVVKDVNNCYDTASYLLTEPEQLVITGNQLKDEYCGHSDGSISIEIAGGTGGYDTRWSDYQTGESASDLAAGSYQVSVFDENRCLATETYEIKNIPAPVVSIRNIDSTKCYGSADGVAELNVSLGTGAIAYLWATDTTDVPYSGKLKAGLQSVVAVDELGCADTAQFTMPQPDSMKIVIAVQNPLCFNDNSGKLTASVSNFKTGLSYKWDNGVDGNENADLYAGTYGVSVTNANGCIAKKNATLVYPAKITIKKVAIDDTKCDHPNGSISVSAAGGTGILKYGVNPENMAAANKIEGLQSGNHKLTVIDENQCSIDTAIFVGANVPPVLVINTRDDVKCHGDANGKVSVGVEGGRMPFVYSWDNGDRTTMSTKNGLGVGSHKAYVYDGFGCSDTLDFAIDEPYMLEIYESSSSDPVCYGYSNGQIVAGVMGGTAPYTYQWGDKQNTAKATGLAAGSHYLNVTDKNGCKAKKYFSLTNPLPVVVDIPDVIDICSNQTADIDAGYEGSFHYWSSANGFESVAQNISVNKKGTYVVTVTTLDGCIGTDSTFVNVSDKEINSNFLLQSDAYVGDTIVMIEISWPLPESIEWSCPEGMTIISDAGDEIEIVADKEGVYDIGLTTYNDICTEQTFKSIVVNPRAQKPKQMLQAAPKIIKSVNVYPSPTTGPFNLEIELNEEHDVSIEVVHISGKLQTVRHMKGDRNYVLNFSNAELNAGIHTISVSAGAEKVTKKVVIVK